MSKLLCETFMLFLFLCRLDEHCIDTRIMYKCKNVFQFAFKCTHVLYFSRNNFHPPFYKWAKITFVCKKTEINNCLSLLYKIMFLIYLSKILFKLDKHLLVVVNCYFLTYFDTKKNS